MSQYHQMWAELGLNLEKHDALLSVLSQAYQSIFLTQSHRPKGMDYFNFVMSEVHGLRIKELLDAKAQGRKVIGSFCVFVPEELILAVDGISVGLCTGAEFAFEDAEKYLPRSTCSLIKSAFGFKLARVCPYLESSDMIVGENTCDGKKKSYETFASLVNNLYIMDLPQQKSVAGRALLKAEYIRFAEALEKLSGKQITQESLHHGITLVNAKRLALHRLSELRKAIPAPISGLDALLINQIFFYDDPARYTKAVQALCDELEQRIAVGQGVHTETMPRIVVSGCPMAVPNWKLPMIVEGSGAIVVGEESCVGARGTKWLTEDQGDSVDQLIDNIVDRYFNIDCAVFTPNPTRIEHVQSLVKSLNANGVIHYNLQFCQPYQIETYALENRLEKQGTPVLRIDTDYSQEDAEQLKTRVEAFIERIIQ